LLARGCPQLKLTWFAGTTIRIHIAGSVLVADAAAAPASVESTELLAGARARFSLHGPDPALVPLEPEGWRPRQAARLIDEAGPQEPALYRIGAAAVLVEAPGEAPLVLVAGPGVPAFGRWADGAVVVLCAGAAAEAVAMAQSL